MLISVHVKHFIKLIVSYSWNSLDTRLEKMLGSKIEEVFMMKKSAEQGSFLVAENWKLYGGY